MAKPDTKPAAKKSQTESPSDTKERLRTAKRLAKGARRFKMVRMRADETDRDITHGDSYAVFGEAGRSGRFILVRVKTGEIVPGTYDLSKFEKVPNARHEN
jgi:hypothetical protein